MNKLGMVCVSNIFVFVDLVFTSTTFFTLNAFSIIKDSLVRNQVLVPFCSINLLKIFTQEVYICTFSYDNSLY